MRILKADRQRLTTTLYRLRKYHACRDRYDHLVAKLGPGYDDHKPINLLTILKHNGADDMLWALCTTSQNCDRVARLMAAAFAEEVLPIFERLRPEDKRPRHTIAVTRRYARGKATAEELAAAGAAARDAARAAARAAAGAAAGAAAWAAAWAAARAAARDAAWAAAGEQQATIIRRYLLLDKAKGAA